jgi:hypothetical protein
MFSMKSRPNRRPIKKRTINIRKSRNRMFTWYYKEPRGSGVRIRIMKRGCIEEAYGMYSETP